MSHEQEKHLLKLVNIFKEEKGFHRLFSLFLDKYKSYGRLENGISVTLSLPTEDEKRALSGLIGKDYSRNKSIRVTIRLLEKAILQTPFGRHFDHIPFQRVFELYAGNKLTTKVEEKEAFYQEREWCFEELLSSTSSVLFHCFIDTLKQEENPKNRFLQLYKQNKPLFLTMMEYIKRICDIFPLTDYMYMPVFAARITSNPHTFDLDREEGKLLISFFQMVKKIENEEELQFETRIETINALLFDYKILRDDLLNAVTLFNIQGTTKRDKAHALLQGACEEKAMFHLPLKEVGNLKSVKTISRKNTLFMIENSVVSSFVANEMNYQEIEGSLIAGNGQLNIATLKFLDLFTQGGGKIYYAGDFDPEGLTIAQKLLHRYKDSVELWCYEEGMYTKSLSTKSISDKSLAQLDSQLEHPTLLKMAQQMKQYKKAGYQENILEPLTNKIVSFYKREEATI